MKTLHTWVSIELWIRFTRGKEFPGAGNKDKFEEKNRKKYQV